MRQSGPLKAILETNTKGLLWVHTCGVGHCDCQCICCHGYNVPAHILQLLYVHYLKHCWQWPYYGATFYEGTLVTKDSKLPNPVRPLFADVFGFDQLS